jgi:hypothetical protein
MELTPSGRHKDKREIQQKKRKNGKARQRTAGDMPGNRPLRIEAMRKPAGWAAAFRFAASRAAPVP